MTQRAAAGLAHAEGEDREALLGTGKYAAFVVAQAPPLTAEQVGRLRQLLTHSRQATLGGAPAGRTDLTASHGRD